MRWYLRSLAACVLMVAAASIYSFATGHSRIGVAGVLVAGVIALFARWFRRCGLALVGTLPVDEPAEQE